MELSLDLGLVETTMLTAMRIVTFLVVAPPFHLRAFPSRVKVALGLGLALLAGPRAAEATDGVPGELLMYSTSGFLGALVLQAVVGFGLGFLVRLVFAAVQTAGSLIDLFGGFQLAMGYDPMSQSQASPFGRLYDFTAVVLLFASDAYQVVLGGLVRTFDTLPLTEGLSLNAFAQLLTGGIADLMIAALQIAGPLVVVLFLADVGLGLLTRVAPALNAFALGFPLKILMTLALGVIAYLTLPQVVSNLTQQAVDLVMEVAK